MITAKLKGFELLDAKLKNLPPRVEQRVVQAAVRSAMTEAAKEIRKAAPKDSDGQSAASKKYGRLRRNIRVTASRRDKRRGQRGAYVHTNSGFWGVFLEFGTRYIAPRPWFLPAFSRSTPLVLKKLSEVLGKGIEKEWDRK